MRAKHTDIPHCVNFASWEFLMYITSSQKNYNDITQKTILKFHSVSFRHLMLTKILKYIL